MSLWQSHCWVDISIKHFSPLPLFGVELSRGPVNIWQKERRQTRQYLAATAFPDCRQMGLNPISNEALILPASMGLSILQSRQSLTCYFWHFRDISNQPLWWEPGNPTKKEGEDRQRPLVRKVHLPSFRRIFINPLPSLSLSVVFPFSLSWLIK